MMELMVVIIVIAVMVMAAVPLSTRMIPYFQVRIEAQNAAAIMRQARLKAASTQRPTRVVLDCREHAGDVTRPCVFSMQAAAYAEGVLTGWERVPIGGMEGRYNMRPAVTARASGGDSLFWIIFMPSSRAFASPTPFEIEFVPEQFKSDSPASARGVWLLTVNGSSGRTTLVRK